MANKPKPVPIGRTPQQTKEFRAVAENLEVLLGARGDGLDRALTLRDMVELGFVEKPANMSVSREIIGEFAKLPDSIEVTPAVQTPTKPTGVVAASSDDHTFIAWDAPLYVGHSYSEVWKSQTDDYATAVMIGTTSIAMYSDVYDGAQNFYWVRHKNVIPDSNAGAIQSTSGVFPSGTIDSIAGSLAVTQVGAIAADRIFASQGSIAELIIGNGHINNAMIGDVIRSNNYVAGLTGWQITKDGIAEFNSLDARGTLTGSTIIGSTIQGTRIEGSLIISDTETLVKTEAWTSSFDSLAFSGGVSDTVTDTISKGTTKFSGRTSFLDIRSASYSDLADRYRYKNFTINPLVVYERRGVANRTEARAKVKFQLKEGANVIADTGWVQCSNHNGVYHWTVDSPDPEYVSYNGVGYFVEIALIWKDNWTSRSGDYMTWSAEDVIYTVTFDANYDGDGVLSLLTTYESSGYSDQHYQTLTFSDTAENV